MQYRPTIARRVRTSRAICCHRRPRRPRRRRRRLRFKRARLKAIIRVVLVVVGMKIKVLSALRTWEIR